MPFHFDKDYVPPEKGRGSKLTGKQERFCHEYLVDFSPTKAVTRAGYKSKNLEIMARALLAHPLVSREIKRLKEERWMKTELEAQWVLNKLMNIVQETETDNPQAALRGLELLGKHLGLYRERQEITGADGAAIKYEQEIKKGAEEFTNKLDKLRRSAEEGEPKVVNIK